MLLICSSGQDALAKAQVVSLWRQVAQQVASPDELDAWALEAEPLPAFREDEDGSAVFSEGACSFPLCSLRR